MLNQILQNSINHLHTFLSTQIPIEDKRFFATWYKHYLKILKLIERHPQKHALEIGLGFGIIPLCLVSMGYKTSTIEHPSREFLTPDFINIFKRHNVHITYADISISLPFKDESFDLICCCDVIEHILPWHVPLLLAEIQRCLKPEGIFILSTPNLCRTSNIIRFLAGRMINPPMIPEKFGTTFDHIREYTPGEIKFILKNSGFKILKTDFGLIPYFDLTRNHHLAKINKLISKMIFFLYKKYGDEIYVKCKKI